MQAYPFFESDLNFPHLSWSVYYGVFVFSLGITTVYMYLHCVFKCFFFFVCYLQASQTVGQFVHRTSYLLGEDHDSIGQAYNQVIVLTA